MCQQLNILRIANSPEHYRVYSEGHKNKSSFHFIVPLSKNVLSYEKENVLKTCK